MEKDEVVDGRFVIDSPASSYGSARVYLAREIGGGPVALKIIELDAEDPHDRLREIEAVSRLRHPRIVRYLAHGLTRSGAVYLATEWIEGETLAQRLRRTGVLPQTAVEIVQRVAEALVEAHRHGVLHLDVKASNVMLEEGLPSRVKVLDFGLARLAGRVGSRSSTVSGRGTPGYVAPERVRGIAPDARADIFGLGCLLFECLVGKAPFRGGHPLSAHARVLADTPPLLRTIVPEASEELEAIIASMLAKDRDERPASAAEVAERLASIRAVEVEEAERAVTRTALDELAALGHEERHFVALVLHDQIERFDADDPEAATEAAARRALALGDAVVVPALEPKGTEFASSRMSTPQTPPPRIEGGLEALLGPTFEIERTASATLLRAERSLTESTPTYPLVGRARELTWLLGLADAAHEGEPRLVVLTGRRGIGKTRLLLDLARSLEGRPGVELIDHLDHRDATALRALFDRAPAASFTVVAARTDLVDRVPTLFTQHRAERMGLAPLPPSAAEALARAAGAVDPARAAHEGEGNPRRILAASRGDLAIATRAALELPSFASLPAAARRVLRAASLLDSPFDEARTRALLPDASRRELTEWLDLLVERGLLVASGGPKERAYDFARAAIRDAAYATLTDPDRELGARLAAAVRELFPQR